MKLCIPLSVSTRLCLLPLVATGQTALAEHCGDSLDCLREQLALVREDTNRRVAELEARIFELARADHGQARMTTDKGLTGATQGSAATRTANGRLRVSGDGRLRYEHTAAPGAQPNRNRGVLRARFAASYAIDEAFSLGARIVTGDSDDPNSADVSMGNFLDDLDVSLDQAFASFHSDKLFVTAGKFSNPLTRSDLVWDGDVNPFGIAGSYQLSEGNRFTTRVTAIYMPVDEQIAGRDSAMSGGQFSLRLQPNKDWSLAMDAGWYDYSVGSLSHADSGDIRGNRLSPDGSAYVSDFNLLDLIVGLDYRGNPHWPVRVTGDYVKNFGARIPGDSGYELDLFFGEASEPGNWRFHYGFAVAEQDAVLTAFSQDNITYASNYRLHTLAADYVLRDHTTLNLTGYLYRLDKLDPALDPVGGDYVSRIRLNLSFSF